VHEARDPAGCDRAQMDLLRDVLKEILEADGSAKPAPELSPAE
jgi:hypothetical protein